MTEYLFPIEDVVIPEPLPHKNEYPFFVVAYWPKGKYWKIYPNMFDASDNDRIKKFIDREHESGWTNIHAVKLPELP